MNKPHSGLACPPRWGTERTDRPTHGGKARVIAEALGLELMPWQQYVLDVALEYDPGSNRLAYRDVGLSVPRQSGKGLALDTPIPTPSGWSTMAELKPGDKLFDEYGRECRVTWISEDRRLDCYRVEVSDGTSVIADGDHLWEVFDIWGHGGRDWLAGPGRRKYHKGTWKVLETRELAGKAAVGNRGKKESRYRLPDSAVLDCEHAVLPIDPYVFGYWLGDGNSGSANITVAADDFPSLSAEIEAAGYLVKNLQEPRPGVFYFRVQISDRKWDSDGFVPRLRSLNVFRNKHIPDEYLRASREQRLALLQGLLDSDGTVGINGDSKTSRSVEFSVCSEPLARTFTELARSLGIRTTFRESDATLNGRVVGRRWRMQFVTELPVFRLARKAARHSEQAPLRKRARTIQDVVPVDSVTTRCIAVDSPSNLFLAGEGLVPTHNSTLMLVLMTLRCVGPFGPGQQVIYTAQTALDARTKWEEDHVQKLDDSKVLARGKDYTVRLSNGAERIRFANSSIWRISATTDTAGHGKTLDLAVVDEAFSHTDFRVDQSFDAPMLTRPEPQMWVVSTAGTSKSVYLNARRKAGRVGVERGDIEGSAWFEWSADLEAETMDPEAWRSCSPALGHTITEGVLSGTIQKLIDKGNEAGARRAYLNLTEDEAEDEALIPFESWERVTDTESNIHERAMIGLAMTPDRQTVSLGVAGLRMEGDWHVQHIKTMGGTGWVVSTVKDLLSNHVAIQGVALDGGGPASSLIADLERSGIDVVKLSGQGYARACGAFTDSVNAARLWHQGQDELAESVGVAKSRPLGDLWVWVRRNGDESVAALEAVTVALGGAALMAEPEVDTSSPVLERGGLFKW